MVEESCDGDGNTVADSGDDSSDGEDLLSVLPDTILHHILFFLPTKFAIRTTVLSKRWKHVWSETPSLSFDFYELSADSIDRTLSRYAASKIQSFDLRLDLHLRGMTSSRVNSWIKFAMSRNAKTLSLHFHGSKTLKHDLPDFFYVNSSVLQLSLELFGLTMAPSSPVSWSSLKNLSLRFCNLADESFVRVLSGCPMLECLKLVSCDGVSYLDLNESLHLRRLEVVCQAWSSGPTKITAPYVHSLRLVCCKLGCSIEGFMSLTEAYVNIAFIRHDILQFEDLLYMAVEMLEQLQNTEELTFGTAFLQMLSLAELCGLPIPMLKTKALTLETMIFKSILLGIARLLQNSSDLKKITYIAICIPIPEEYLDSCVHHMGVNQDKLWGHKLSVFPHMSDTLQSLESKASEPKLIASFIEFLLQSSRALETMLIRFGYHIKASVLEELREVTRKLSSDRSRNSSNVSVLLLK